MIYILFLISCGQIANNTSPVVVRADVNDVTLAIARDIFTAPDFDTMQQIVNENKDFFENCNGAINDKGDNILNAIFDIKRLDSTYPELDKYMKVDLCKFLIAKGVNPFQANLSGERVSSVALNANGVEKIAFSLKDFFTELESRYSEFSLEYVEDLEEQLLDPQVLGDSSVAKMVALLSVTQAARGGCLRGIENDNHETPLVILANQNIDYVDDEKFSLLGFAGIPIEEENIEGYDALETAIKSGNVSLVEHIQEEFKDSNLVNNIEDFKEILLQKIIDLSSNQWEFDVRVNAVMKIAGLEDIKDAKISLQGFKVSALHYAVYLQKRVLIPSLLTVDNIFESFFYNASKGSIGIRQKESETKGSELKESRAKGSESKESEAQSIDEVKRSNPIANNQIRVLKLSNGMEGALQEGTVLEIAALNKDIETLFILFKQVLSFGSFTFSNIHQNYFNLLKENVILLNKYFYIYPDSLERKEIELFLLPYVVLLHDSGKIEEIMSFFTTDSKNNLIFFAILERAKYAYYSNEEMFKKIDDIVWMAIKELRLQATPDALAALLELTKKLDIRLMDVSSDIRNGIGFYVTPVEHIISESIDPIEILNLFLSDDDKNQLFVNLYGDDGNISKSFNYFEYALHLKKYEYLPYLSTKQNLNMKFPNTDIDLLEYAVLNGNYELVKNLVSKISLIEAHLINDGNFYLNNGMFSSILTTFIPMSERDKRYFSLASIDSSDEDMIYENTILHLALQIAHAGYDIRIFEELVKIEDSINSLNSRGKTVLHIATKMIGSNLELGKSILEIINKGYGVDKSTLDANGLNILHIAYFQSINGLKRYLTDNFDQYFCGNGNQFQQFVMKDNSKDFKDSIKDGNEYITNIFQEMVVNDPANLDKLNLSTEDKSRVYSIVTKSNQISINAPLHFAIQEKRYSVLTYLITKSNFNLRVNDKTPYSLLIDQNPTVDEESLFKDALRSLGQNYFELIYPITSMDEEPIS